MTRDTRRRPNRRHVLTGLAGAGAAAVLAPAPARADAMDRLNAWFKLLPEALDHWAVKAHDNDPLRASIAPKSPAPGAAKRVMVLYPRKSTAYDVAITQLLGVFHDRGVNARFEAVNFDRKAALGHARLDAAHREGYDLVFSMGSESTEFLWDHRRDSKVPIVSVCSKDPVQLGQMRDYETGSGVNFAFTSLNVLLDVQIAYLKRLKPKLAAIGILVDGQNKSAVQTQADPLVEAAGALGIDAFNVVVQAPPRAAAELAALVPAALERMKRRDPALDNSLFWITGSTSVFNEIATINRHAGRVPVLSVVPDVVQEGPDSAVLSIGVSFESNAFLAGLYGVDILAGRAKAGALKVGIVSPPDIAVNFLRARAIGLKIPFEFFEQAEFVYGVDGKPVRRRGQNLVRRPAPTRPG